MRRLDTPESFRGVDRRELRRRALRVALLLVAIGLAIALAPGLGELRTRIGEADPVWLVVAVLMEALSGLSYVWMFRPVFMPNYPWLDAQRVGWAELGMGSIVPSSGIAGLALGAWIFSRVGADPKVIARRSLAFYLIKGGANFVAVAVIGLALFAGAGPSLSPWLTVFPALLSVGLIGGLAVLPRCGPSAGASPGARGVRRAASTALRELTVAVREAGVILRRREPGVIGGALGYWFFDNAVLIATFAAFGDPQPVLIVLLAYLIGQLGGLLPVPGGIGGIDAGLIGTFVVYGIPLQTAFVAVLAYRVILFWLPLMAGGVAYWSVERRISEIRREQAR